MNCVPKRIGAWNFVAASGLVVPLKTNWSKAIYSQMLTRVYSDGSQSADHAATCAKREPDGISTNSSAGNLLHRPAAIRISPLAPHPIEVRLEGGPGKQYGREQWRTDGARHLLDASRQSNADQLEEPEDGQLPSKTFMGSFPMRYSCGFRL